MKKTNIILLRHGQTHWNVQKIWQGTSESELTSLGEEQALGAKYVLDDIKVDYAYVSPLLRTIQTLNIVINNTSLEYKENSDLKEIHLGEWEGQKHEDIKISNREQSDNFFFNQDKFNVKGAETFYDLQKRVVKVLDDIFLKHEGQTVLVVSHCMSIKVALAYYCDIKMNELNKINNPKNAELIFLEKEKDVIRIA